MQGTLPDAEEESQMNKIQLLVSRLGCDKHHKKVCLGAKGYGSIEEGDSRSKEEQREGLGSTVTEKSWINRQKWRWGKG